MGQSLNFHKTFIPERHFLHALLTYVAQGKSGSLQQMAEETRIPMGRSSGKLLAIINYALGMGLVHKENSLNSNARRLSLTPFGQSVFLKDSMLTKSFTQWMVHLHLCLPDEGAIAWHMVFGRGTDVLGSRYTARDLEDYLVRQFGPGRNRTGPLLRTYLRDEALGRARILEYKNNTVRRNKAPLLEHFGIGYAAFVTQLMERNFPDFSQVSLRDLENKSRWLSVCLWTESDLEIALSLMERTGFVSIDRQIRPYLIEKKYDSKFMWTKAYQGAV